MERMIESSRLVGTSHGRLVGDKVYLHKWRIFDPDIGPNAKVATVTRWESDPLWTVRVADRGGIEWLASSVERAVDDVQTYLDAIAIGGDKLIRLFEHVNVYAEARNAMRASV